MAEGQRKRRRNHHDSNAAQKLHPAGQWRTSKQDSSHGEKLQSMQPGRGANVAVGQRKRRHNHHEGNAVQERQDKGARVGSELGQDIDVAKLQDILGKIAG